MDRFNVIDASKSSMCYISGRLDSLMKEHSNWDYDQQQQSQSIMDTTVSWINSSSDSYLVYLWLFL